MSEATPEFKALQEQMEQDKDADTKLGRLIDFMEASLSHSGAPRFKSFWEARKLSLDLFKEVSTPQIRSQLWARYSHLSKEARRLKDLLDEESAFNVEQIEMAIAALENACEEAGLKSETPGTNPPLLDPVPCHTLEREWSFYEPRQRELNLLNLHASRIHAMRKELIRTEMRIRQKNKFFERLSAAGDKIFPRRKSLIDEVSSKFQEDVSQFIRTYFASQVNESLFFLRSEIKALQGVAKMLTLSAHVFKDTRQALSECWDKLKVEEKELKKSRQEKREIYKANHQELSEKLKTLRGRFETKELAASQLEKELYSFQQEMRNLELGPGEVRALKAELESVREALFAEVRREEESRAREAEVRDQEKREKILNFKNRALGLIAEAPKLGSEAILKERELILEEIQASHLSRHDKLELEKVFKPLKDILTEKNEARLLNLPENDRQALEQLKELLNERKVRRKEMREQVEELRKSAGSSGLDFTKALDISQLHAEEKEKLDKLNEGIRELEDKIRSYERPSVQSSD